MNKRAPQYNEQKQKALSWIIFVLEMTAIGATLGFWIGSFAG